MQAERGQRSVCPLTDQALGIFVLRILVLRIFVLLMLVQPQISQGRSSKTSDIDAYCRSVRNEFLESTPAFFSGPDPWVQLDRLPDSFSDAAVATVYSEGSRVKWLVLEMQDGDNAWYETTSYFFDERGLLEKRERRLDQYASRIVVNEDLYFENGKRIKNSFHHQQLSENISAGQDKENWDTFYDPNAPLYTSTAELPEVILKVGWKQLASFSHIYDVDALPSLLKFSRPVLFTR